MRLNVVTALTVLLAWAASCAGSPTVRKFGPTGRIVGGEPLFPNELKYIVPIFFKDNQVCGGVVLSPDYVLTAAQCVHYGGTGRDDYKIIAGEHSLSTVTGAEQIRYPSSIIVHPEFDAWWLMNDIAIVKLNMSLTFNGAVSAVQLPSQGHIASGNCIVTGWGAAEPDGEESDVPQRASVPIVTEEECKNAYGADEVTEDMICAGLPAGGKDACRGDSGSGLICTDIGSPYVAGLVSWGQGCGLPGYPGVYVEVAKFREWIDSVISP